MTPAEIRAAASEYLAGFDSPDPIAAIAERGTSEEDDARLEEVYGKDWPAIALDIQRQCQERQPQRSDAYYHTEIRGYRGMTPSPSRVRVGQVWAIGGVQMIVLRRHGPGEWVLGRYSGRGLTVPAETRNLSAFRRNVFLGRSAVTPA